MENKTIYKSAIRTGMGVWNYYVSTLSYKEIANYVKMPDEIYQSDEMSELLQRALTNNVNAICEYLSTEKERFFNSLVLAVYEGSPKWHEGVFEMEGEEYSNIGILELTGEEKIFPVDGQHRVAAIKKLVENGEINEGEEVPVIYISHVNDKEGIQRTRRLFTTLNRYAKPVKLNETIALDEDDIAAIVTRRLVEKEEYFGAGRMAATKTESIQKKDKKSFSTIITLYYCNTELLSSFIVDKNFEKKNFQRFRQPEEVNEQFYEYVTSFWKKLADINTEFGEYMSKEPDSSAYRNEEGGNLLFRPAGLKSFVGVVNHIHLVTGKSFNDILEKYRMLDFTLTSSPWQGVLWNNGKMKMDNKDLVRQFLYLYYDKEWKDSKGKPIELEKVFSEYRALLGSDESDIELFQRIIQQE